MPDTSLFRLDGKSAVVCLDVDLAAAGRVATGIGSLASAAALDIRDPHAVAEAFDRIVEIHGHLDVVVCTPSINVRRPILQYTSDDFDRVVALNLKGSFNVVQAAGRVMTAQQSGSIIMFSSIRSQVAGPTLFLASEAASFVTGAILFADGGWTAMDGRFMPPGMADA
jgi:NAD(P)-dependent dehydrogenase (short-subunit alcohol dehydrogenase family)